MKKFRSVILIGFTLSFLLTEAQNKSTTSIEKNSFSGNILGTASYIGFSYERLLFERVSAEIGIGLIGYGIGAIAYPLRAVRIGHLSPYIGLKYTNHAIVDGENKAATYVPIGLTYFSNLGLNFSMDIGPSHFLHKSPGFMPTLEELEKYPFTDFGLWGNLKIGFRL